MASLDSAGEQLTGVFRKKTRTRRDQSMNHMQKRLIEDCLVDPKAEHRPFLIHSSLRPPLPEPLFLRGVLFALAIEAVAGVVLFCLVR
jgi:hypothetical protein